MTHLHNVIQPKWILGLTATPFRTDSVRLCFNRIVQDAGIHRLIQDGYLSQYEHYTVPTWDVFQLADHYCADPDRWGKSIFFFHTLDECFALNTLLQARGIRSDVVTGASDRVAQLTAFRRGDLQVVINCMVLTEGFDEPTLQTVWVRPSARGPTMQMAGRALRKCDGISAKRIVQCKQTPHPFPKTAMCRQQYLWQSGEWRTLSINPKLNLCTANVLRALVQTDVDLPKFVKRDDGRRRRRNLRF
jgi:superfamily II DNA or RNA helicase